MILVRMTSFIKRYWREIAYYTAVMLVLGGLAWGAEAYRAGRETDMQVPLTVSADAVQQEHEKERIALPEGMEILNVFSGEPVWNEDLLCWQAHTGVDFACEYAAAFCDGVVTAIGESSVYGGFVDVERERYLLRYCSIIPDVDLQVGAEIRMGDRIGEADDSLPGEMHMGAHVHVEALCDGEILDVMRLVQTSD